MGKVQIDLNEIINSLIERYNSNIERLKEIIVRDGKKPSVKIINTGDDPASALYIRNKTKLLSDNGVDVEIINTFNEDEIRQIVHKCNDEGHSLILQLPLSNNISSSFNELISELDMILDCDNLTPKSRGFENLPVTSYVLSEILYDVITKLLTNKPYVKVHLIGYGATTNKGLYSWLMKQKNVITRVSNSKTPYNEKETNNDWADIIVSSTGVPGSLKVKNKIVISPTIACVDREKNIWSTDLYHAFKKDNITHKVTGGIGKLTVLCLCENVLRGSLLFEPRLK